MGVHNSEVGSRNIERFFIETLTDGAGIEDRPMDIHAVRCVEKMGKELRAMIPRESTGV